MKWLLEVKLENEMTRMGCDGCPTMRKKKVFFTGFGA
jgi:hypothetical protein